MSTSAAGATVRDVWSAVARLFAERGIPRPETEARDLMAAVLNHPRFWPVLNPEFELDATTLQRLECAAARRARGAPFAYAVGRATFRYLTLAVDERVLIPRPETELLIELVLRHRPTGAAAVDLGTGSGAIALALSSEGRFDRVVATDVSSDALDVARHNAALVAPSLNAPVEFRAGCAFSPLRKGELFDVIVSNPPYIAPSEVEELPGLVRDWEPSTALICGDDGLAVTKAIIQGASRRLTPGGLLALELDSRRAECATALARDTGHFREVTLRRDWSGRPRFLVATT
jgi:release factor glutamine methyltransferase